MQHITAIGFDLFDTLITVAQPSRHEAPARLLRSLQAQGFSIEETTFRPVYREVVQQFLDQARQEGKETHNRFWISATLQRLGYDVQPEDGRIAQAVEVYFSAFIEYARLVPDTLDTLAILKNRYRLGLLSNLTHGPAARQILDCLGLTPFFDTILISGELGYRKPHARVFHALTEQLVVPKEQVAFIGDDLEADVKGAQQAGLQPIWSLHGRPQLPTDPAVPTIASWRELLTLLKTS
jgi:putative hydrolase of the HAD superfamily